MEIELYYNQSDARVINNSLISFNLVQGTLKDGCSIMNPSVILDTDLILKCNYCYIPQFERYYTFTEVTSIRTGLFEVQMSCDVLMSFRRDILNTGAVVDKQTDEWNGNEYIDDGSLVAENSLFTSIYDFPSGFNSSGEYILITAG